MKKLKWILAFTSIAYSPFAFSATCTAGTGARNWSATGTWSCGAVPTTADTVVIPNTSVVTLDVNSTAIVSITINAGGTLQGDGSGKILSIAGAGTNDLVNNGTLDFSGIVGAGGSKAAVLRDASGTMDMVQTTAATWKFSTIDANGLAITLSGITNIEFNGFATPFQNATAANISGTLTCTWTFSGNVAQAFDSGTEARMTTWGNGTTSFVVSNTAGLTLGAADTLSGNLTISPNAILTLPGTLVVNGNNLVVGAGATLNLAGTTTAIPTSTTKTFAATSITNYMGTGNQAVGAATYGDLNLLGGGTKTATAAFNVQGDLSVAGGTTFALAGSTTPMPTVSGSKTFDPASTVSYTGTGAQTISAETYGNLTLNALLQTKTAAAGTINVVGNFTIAANTTYKGNTNNPTVNIGGNLANSGTFTSGSGTYTFNGTAAQAITGVTAFGGSVVVSDAAPTGCTISAAITVAGNLTVSAGGIFTIAGTTTAMPTVTGTKTFDPTSTVRYAGSGNQAIAIATYGNLDLSNAGTKTPAAGTLTVAGDFTVAAVTFAGNTSNPTVNIAGDLNKSSGTFTTGSGTYTFNGNSPQAIIGVTAFTGAVTISNTSSTGVTIAAATTIGGAFNLNAAAVLTLGGTTTPMPTVTGTKTFNATSLTRYAGSGAQVVAAQTYGNIEFSGGNTKTPAAGTLTIAGDFSLLASTTYSGANNPTVSIAGDFTNSGTAFTSGTGTYTFNGTALQNFAGATTFTRMTIANTAALPNPVVSLSADVTVSTLLTITSGGILTNTFKVILPSGSSLTGASSGTGWIVGNLQKFIAAGTSTVNFEIGSLGTVAPSLAYTPVSLTFTGVGAGGGSVIVNNTLGNHSQIASSGLNVSLHVNRWWTVTTSGVSGTALPAFTNYSATFTFVTQDLDISTNTANLFVNRYNASWLAPTTSTRTATTTLATGITALGDFIIGEPASITITKISTVISDLVNGTSNPKRIPGALIEYTITITTPARAIAASTAVLSTDDLSTMAANISYVTGSLVVDGVAEDDDATNGGTSNPDVGNYNSASKLITVNLGTINPGTSKSYKFRVTIN